MSRTFRRPNVSNQPAATADFTITKAIDGRSVAFFCLRLLGELIVEKIERGGNVAVLRSPGFGAGWSTWNGDDIRESLCMNAEIVQAVLDGNKGKAAEIAERLHPNVFTEGCDDLVVEWVPKGEAFEITECDGSESLVIIGELTYMIG